jgi:hypothetical protein
MLPSCSACTPLHPLALLSLSLYILVYSLLFVSSFAMIGSLARTISWVLIEGLRKHCTVAKVLII